MPKQAGEVKKGSYIMLKGHPCKVVDYSTSKTGKHGHAKAHIVGIDIFTGKKCEDLCPTSHNMSEPIVKKFEYTVMDVTDEGALSLLTAEGEQSKTYDRGWVSLACFRSNFGGLVLGCINADFYNQILILQHFSRFT